MNFSQFMELKFIEWQHQEGGRKTVADFAKYLGVAQTTASSYMNGKRIPEGDKLERIADKLGFEVYDVLGIPRPDPDLLYIEKHWEDVSEEFRVKFRKEVERQLENEDAKRIHKNRGSHAHS